MSTIASPNDWHRLRLLATRLAHYQPAVLVLAIVVQIGQVLTGYDKGWPTVWINASVCALMVPTYVAAMWHDRQLCERCAEQTPLDIGATAERERYILWWHHYDGYFGLGLLGAAILVKWQLHIDTFFYVMFSYFAVGAVAALRHRLLEPKCPYCNWRDGGGKEKSPSPAPIPVATADR